MAQSSNLVEGAKNFESKFENLVNKIPTYKGGADKSWHAEKVREANESFRKKAGEKRKVGGAAKGRAATSKPTTRKKARQKLTTKG